MYTTCSVSSNPACKVSVFVAASVSVTTRPVPWNIPDVSAVSVNTHVSMMSTTLPTLPVPALPTYTVTATVSFFWGLRFSSVSVT